MKKTTNHLKTAILLIPFIVLATSILTPKANADVILPGHKLVSKCLRVSNVSSFPDYKIIYSPVGTPGSNDAWYVEGDNTCVSHIYKFADNPKFYAVPTSEFSESKLEDISNFGNSLLPSDTSLSQDDPDQVPIDDPLDSIIYTFEIIRIDCDKLWIFLLSKETKYVDGSSSIMTFDIAPLPEPSDCGNDNRKYDNNFQNTSTQPDNDSGQNTNTDENESNIESNTDVVAEDIESENQGTVLGTRNKSLDKVKDVAFSPIGLTVMASAVLGGLGLGAVTVFVLRKKLLLKTA